MLFTEEQLAAGFAAWERALRDNPSAFMSYGDCRETPVEELAKNNAAKLVRRIPRLIRVANSLKRKQQ